MRDLDISVIDNKELTMEPKSRIDNTSQRNQVIRIQLLMEDIPEGIELNLKLS